MAVSVGHRDADSVDALVETHSPRATQIGSAKHKVLLFMTYFNTTLPVIREICACLLTTKARTGNSKHEIILFLPRTPLTLVLFGKGHVLRSRVVTC